MTKDENELRLLSIFHYVVGGITALFACIPFIHVGIGLMMVSGAMRDGIGGPPVAMGWIFVVLGGLGILLGWTMAILTAISGRKLQRRRSYQFCFVVACVECIFMPFGTILGVFTIIVLQRESVKQLFAPL